MACASASGSEPISTHTSSTSSASACTTPSTRWAMAEASAVKKRVSKRRTRPGGVMARAIRNRLDGSGSRPASANGFQGPSSFAVLLDLAAEAEARLLAGLADRRDSRAHVRGRRVDLRTALRAGWPRAPRVIGAATGTRLSALSTRPPGKTILAGHEHHLVVALADQHFRLWRRSGRSGSASRHPWAGNRDDDRLLSLRGPPCRSLPAVASVPSPSGFFVVSV